MNRNPREIIPSAPDFNDIKNNNQPNYQPTRHSNNQINQTAQFPINQTAQFPINQQFTNNLMQTSGYFTKRTSNQYAMTSDFSKRTSQYPMQQPVFHVQPYLHPGPPAYSEINNHLPNPLIQPPIPYLAPCQYQSQSFQNQPLPCQNQYNYDPQKTNHVLFDPSAFDSSARFNQGARFVLPPPPPGSIPTVHQIAAANGHQVVLGKKKSNWFFQKGDGSVFW